jgi:transcriptional regulator with XRE-family HTH domain
MSEVLLSEKPTNELFSELQSADSYEDFAVKNKDVFTKGSISEYLSNLLKEKNIPLKDAVNNSGIERIYAYHLFSGRKIPSRDKLIAISLGLGLSLDETQALMKFSCNRPLYPKNERDSALIYAVINGLTVRETQALLFEKHFEAL